MRGLSVQYTASFFLKHRMFCFKPELSGDCLVHLQGSLGFSLNRYLSQDTVRPNSRHTLCATNLLSSTRCADAHSIINQPPDGCAAYGRADHGVQRHLNCVVSRAKNRERLPWRPLVSMNEVNRRSNGGGNEGKLGGLGTRPR